VAIGIAVRGGTVYVGGGQPSSLVVTASLILGAAGFAVLALAAHRAPGGRGRRFGFGALAVGLAVTVVSGILSAASTVDPLESLPMLVLSGFGTMAIIVGIIATVMSLATPEPGS